MEAVVPRVPAWERDPVGDPWGKVLQAAAPNRRLRVLLNDCALVKAEDDLVVVSVSQALMSSAQASEKDLCRLLALAWDRAVRLELRVAGAEEKPSQESVGDAGTNAGEKGEETVASRIGAKPTPVPAALSDAATVGNHPLVRQAMELFNAKLIGVQPRKPT